MYYYRPLTKPVPVKPYVELLVSFAYPDIFAVKKVVDYLQVNCKRVEWLNSFQVKILTIRSEDDIAVALHFANPEFDSSVVNYF